MDPISTGQLTRDEIDKGEQDPNYRLSSARARWRCTTGKKKGPRLRRCRAATSGERDPVAGAQHTPELKDAQIMRPGRHHQDTIASVRDRPTGTPPP